MDDEMKRNEDLEADLFLPEELKNKVDILGGELTQLYADWLMFKQCFCTSRVRSELLFDQAGGFFSCVHGMMRASLAAGICRLIDPAVTGSKTNLVLERLANEIDDAGFVELAASLQKMLAGIREKAAGIQQYRHKKVGHLDEAISLGEKKLDGFGMEHIEEVLSGMEDFLNAVNLRFPDKVFNAYSTVHVYDGVDILARRLCESLALRKLIADGVITHDVADNAGARADC